MLLANQIREYVKNHIITPAKGEGRRFVIVRSGDVHKAMGLRSRMPAVCSAIGSEKFMQESSAKLVARKGPNQGATVEWVFEI